MTGACRVARTVPIPPRAPGYPRRLRIVCSCGTTATSVSGETGTWAAYYKHQARVAAKATS